MAVVEFLGFGMLLEAKFKVDREGEIGNRGLKCPHFQFVEAGVFVYPVSRVAAGVASGRPGNDHGSDQFGDQIPVGGFIDPQLIEVIHHMPVSIHHDQTAR